jgi:DNA modification methylase
MHPTCKPVAMIADVLLDASDRGEVVLDAFGGSGSTLMAAERVGRRARLLELDPGYVDVTLERWAKRTGLQAVHADTGKTYDQVKAEGEANGHA